jgi:hypothetical protein
MIAGVPLPLSQAIKRSGPQENTDRLFSQQAVCQKRREERGACACEDA